MKTPMQFLLEKIENGDFLDKPKAIGEFIKYNLLEKEKEQNDESYQEGYQNGHEAAMNYIENLIRKR